MKICSTCKIIKPLTEFHKSAASRDGLRGVCKACGKITAAAYMLANQEKIKAYTAMYRADNKDKIMASMAKWRAENIAHEKAYTAKYRAENHEKIRASKAVYRAANPYKHKAAAAAWRAANRDRCKTLKDKWVEANPERAAEISRNKEARRRARKAGSGGQLSKGLSAKLFKLQRGKCVCCRGSLGDNFHLDHIMPLALGGANTDNNIQLLCKTCNLKKSAKHPISFMQERGFLL